ncbi:MAG: 4Fe-4S binding protein [Acholeplasmataceae bacterium]|jgi:epoxyqueuosine reductase|nr:4Fe-4S binding protein [Acholeplasmataceae bacterium]
MYEKLSQTFDFVGVIDVEKYPNYYQFEQLKAIKSIFVVGLAYPNVFLSHQDDSFTASMYTYGYDYHLVIKELVEVALKDFEYTVLVDNHPLDERKCLELTGLAYLAKNDLMINRDYGSYFFIGLILSKTRQQEVIIENTDSCGSCRICIDACPVEALTNGFQIDKCLSAKNQLKEPFDEQTIKKNYLLLGCDICQRVCPKNKTMVKDYYQALEAKPTAYVLIDDLFNLSNRNFYNKYGKHAYLWRGKTLLLRNALTILLRRKNFNYNEKIKETIKNPNYPNWYKTDALKILKRLEDIKNKK